MTNILVPLIYTWLSIGKTIDLRDYASIAGYNVKSIFSEDVSVNVTEVSEIESNYYVLPDDNFPFSKISLPIDLILRDQPGLIYRNLIDPAFHTTFHSFDSATILIVQEYKKIDKSIGKYPYEEPVSNWHENIAIKNHTHYVSKMHYGGRCISKLSVRSRVTGDVQIIRRILTDVMGESGKMGKDTVDLWRKAFKAINESEEIRGEIGVPFGLMCSHVVAAEETYHDPESFLEYLAEFPKYVKVRDLNGPLHENPIYVTLTPLEVFDPRFKTVEKDEVAECYMRKLRTMYSDVEYTYSQISGWFHRMDDEEVKGFKEVEEMVLMLRDVKRAVKLLAHSSLSMYENINYEQFNNVFEKYYEGLNYSTKTYYTCYQRLYDKFGYKCDDAFRKPVKGSLLVESYEVVRRKSFCIAECQKTCVLDNTCRAVGYSKSKNTCLIYTRSTSSAKIIFPVSRFSDDMEIYDRNCHF